MTHYNVKPPPRRTTPATRLNGLLMACHAPPGPSSAAGRVYVESFCFDEEILKKNSYFETVFQT